MDEKIAYLEKLRVAFRKQRESKVSKSLKHVTVRSTVEVARRDGWMDQILKLLENARVRGMLTMDLFEFWPKAKSGLRLVLSAMSAEGQIVYVLEPDATGMASNRRRYFHPRFAPKGAK